MTFKLPREELGYQKSADSVAGQEVTRSLSELIAEERKEIFEKRGSKVRKPHQFGGTFSIH